MFDFIQKIIYSLFSIQEKMLSKKLRKTLKRSYSNKTSKRVFGLAASLELTSQTNKNKQKLESNVKIILKKYENNPQKLLDFVERSGTVVHKIPYADKILKLIGYEEGLLPQISGLKAFYLCLCLNILSSKKTNISFNTEPMYVLRDLPLEAVFVAQQFYKWYAMKLDLPGFDAQSQENFQKFLSPSVDEKIKELSVEEILGLKEAIARDREAINFIIDFAKATGGTQSSVEKITTSGASA